MTGSRFRVEERSGIVAVYDTEHPEYQDTPGCHADYPWTVCSWHGAYDETAGHWNIDQRWIDKARAACELLNTLSANATGERPETRSDDRTQIVVRLRRSYWHDNDGAYQRTSLRYLKRYTKGFNFFYEDCSMVGTEDVIPKIVNLAKCEDGIYLLVMCNAHRDWETGHVEDWDYQLLPFSPNDRLHGREGSEE